MRLFFLQFISALFLMGFCHADEKSTSDWVDLLNDDSLKLWESGSKKGGEVGNLWTLKNGVLSLNKEKEGRGGQLITKKKYFDFELKFEFKIAHAGNSGIKYRTKDGIGCEYQILDDDHAKDNKNPTHRAACLYELVAVPEDRQLHTPASGKWNKGRIVAKGDQIEHWLNDQKVVSIKFGSKDWKKRFEKSKYTKYPDFATHAGPILLQDHGDTVSFRNLKIRELSVDKNKSKSKSASATVKESKKTEIKEPLAYTVNCKACHLLDQTLVGPSLVELADLYPNNKLPEFIKWCIEPGKKRPLMAQMPSMAHVPEEQLTEIFHYLKKATVGVKRVRTSGKDPFANAPATTQRPRVIRTFVPHAGPASVVIALPTEQKHNIIWDTDQCRLRYIATGTFDNWPYLRSNGNALAKVGDVIYTEESPVFKSEDLKFKGYRLTKDGLPVFLYSIDGVSVEENILLKEGVIQRVINFSSDVPDHILPSEKTDKLSVESSLDGRNSIIINYTAL